MKRRPFIQPKSIAHMVVVGRPGEFDSDVASMDRVIASRPKFRPHHHDYQGGACRLCGAEQPAGEPRA